MFYQFNQVCLCYFVSLFLCILCFQRILLFAEPACGKARNICYYFAKVCVRASGFVRAITPTFMHGFQNYLIQLLSLRRRSVI